MQAWVAWERSHMQVMDGHPNGLFQDGKGANEILKNIKSQLYLELVYCSRSATHFVSLA